MLCFVITFDSIHIANHLAIEFVVIEARSGRRHDSEASSQQHQPQNHLQANCRQRQPSVHAKALNGSNGNQQHQSESDPAE